MSWAEDNGHDIYDCEDFDFLDYGSGSALNARCEVSQTQWKLLDGTVVEIKDMDDEHLHNCIKLLKSRRRNPPRLDNMKKELASRPKLPSYFN